MKNRTYRYMEDEALYPFGYGLTYSKVEVSNLQISSYDNQNEKVTLSVDVKNVGNYDTEEVVQCYIKDLESKYAVLNHKLCGFKRVALKCGESKNIAMTIDEKAFEVVNENGERIVDSRKFKIYVGISQPDKRSMELTGSKPLESLIELN